MANRRFIDFPIAATVGNNDIVLIWQDGMNKQTTKATLFQGSPQSLAGLTDVDISALNNGQILQYNSTTSKWENVDRTDINLSELGDVTIVAPANGQDLVYNSSTGKWENSSAGYVPYTGAVTTVNLGAQTIQAGSFVKAGGTSAQFLKANGSVDSTAYGTGTVTSVALTMPSAFSVGGSPITTAGTLAVTGAGTVGQYIRGDGSLANFPATTGGGSSVTYYLNSSVSQGTIGGVAYREVNRTPIFGAGTDISIGSNGYIANFITDAGDPNKLLIPAGNWNLETYFSANNGGGSPTFYVELYKYNGTTFTLIATSSGTPELIAFGTNINPYFTTLAVPETVLALTDRLALRYYVNTSGRTITLHTENGHLCQVITTFTTGLTALNGLTNQVQFFAVGSAGTDFAISSATDTHTFNLPTASATNRGALSSADWTTFNNKQNALTNPVTGTGSAGQVVYWSSGSAITGESNLFWDSTNDRLSIGSNITTQQFSVFGATDTRAEIVSTSNSTAGTFFRVLNSGTQVASSTIRITNSGILEFYSGTTSETLNLSIYSNGSAQFASILTANSFVKSGGTSSQFLKADGSIDSSVYYLASNPSGFTSNTGTVTSVGLSSATSGVTIGSTPITTSGTITLAIATASGSQNGLLSSTDWTTFNGKQNALINPVTGTGTTNYVSKFTGASAIGNSLIFDNGTNVGVNTTTFINVDTGWTNFTVNGSSVGLVGVKSNGNNIGAMYGNSANNDFTIQAYGASNNARMNFLTASELRMSINGNGNVVIGNITPPSKLSVEWNKSTAFSGLGVYDSQAFNASNHGGTVTFGGTFNSGGSYTEWSAIGGMKSNTTDGNVSGDINFYTRLNSSAMTERMRIISSGNVVIGTSNATTLRFTVAQLFSSHSMPALGSLGGLFGFFNTDTEGGDLKYGLVGEVSGASGDVSLQAQRVDGSATAYNIILQQNGGKVVIGTATSGASKLRIVGLPTSSAGLSSGDVYNLSGVLMIA